MLLYQVTNPVSLLSSLMLQAVVVFFKIFKKKKKRIWNIRDWLKHKNLLINRNNSDSSRERLMPWSVRIYTLKIVFPDAALFAVLRGLVGDW